MADTVQDREPFFNKQFWRMTLIAAFSQIIVLVIALTAGAVFGGKIDQLTNLFATMNATLESVESTINTVVGIDTGNLQEQAAGIAESADILGEGVGDGGANAIDRIGEAWRNFGQEPDDGGE